MKRIFRRELGRNYLVLETETEQQERDPGKLPDEMTVRGFSYAMTMAERNCIPGFLPIHSQEVNGRLQFWYEITSKQPLTVLFETMYLREGQVKALFQSMGQAIESAGAYLLEPDGLLFSPEDIYMDPDTFACAFCFLDDGKTAERPESERLEELAQFLLKKTDHTDRAAVRLVYPFYAGVKDAKKDLQQLLTELLKDDRITQGQSDWSEGRKPTHPPIGRYMNGSFRREAEPASDFSREPFPENEVGNLSEQALENPLSPVADASLPDQEQEKLDWSMFEPDQSEESKGKGSGKRILILSLLGGGFGLGGGAAWYLLSLDLTQAGALAAALGALWWMLQRILFPGEKELGRKQKKKTARSQEEEFWKVLYGEQGEGAAGEEYYPVDFGSPAPPKEDSRGEGRRKASRGEARRSAEETPPRILGKMDETGEGSGVTECILLTDRIPKAQDGNMEEPFQKPMLYLKSKSLRTGRDIIPGEAPLLIGKKKEQVHAWINAPSVSRIHARLETKEEALFLTDLHSTNGTYVNGTLLPSNEPKMLEIGDEVRFADTVYFVRQRMDVKREFS